MRSVLTFFGLLLTASTLVAQTQVVQTIQNLNLKAYLCDVSGKTQGAGAFNFTSTKSIFATDEAEAIKLCLLRVGANALIGQKTDGAAVISQIGSNEILGSDSVIIESIKIRGPILPK